jgi:putative flippase GtrA
MATLTVCIGNSDDGLTQREWADYWRDVNLEVSTSASHVFGVFLSVPNSPYQNACWVFEGELTPDLEESLATLARRFRQDSIAVSVGETTMVRSAEREGQA